jgi:hypothetical protein
MQTTTAAKYRSAPVRSTKRRLDIKTLHHLAYRLATPLDILLRTAEYAALHYRESRYVPKKRGSARRTIDAPDPHLKEIQRRIYRRLLAEVWLPDTLHAYRKERSVVTAMTPHRGPRFWWQTDIAAFYPSIRSYNVREIFLSLGCSPHVARVLTKLTTLHHRLPQGAPTSPALANLYLRCFRVADRLEGLARKHGLRVTLFGDDIIVSGERPFMGLRSHIEDVITSTGLRLKPDKTTAVVGPDARHQALGIVANARGCELDASRAYRRHVRSLLRLCRRFGLGVLTARGLTTEPAAFLRGKIGFAVFVNDDNRALFRELHEVLEMDRARSVALEAPAHA